MCQCPHGLQPHCYPYWTNVNNLIVNGVNALTGFNLIATTLRGSSESFYIIVSMPSRASTSLLHHFDNYGDMTVLYGVNALTGFNLIATVPLQKARIYAGFRAYFCRYLSEYSGNSCFSCMFIIWTYLMRQNLALTLESVYHQNSLLSSCFSLFLKLFLHCHHSQKGYSCITVLPFPLRKWWLRRM